MDLNQLSAVFTIFGNLALVVSMFLLVREVRANVLLTRAVNAQSMVELSSPIMLSLVQDRQMAELYFRSAASYETLDDVDRLRYRHLLVWWLIFYENIYYQRRQRYLDSHAFIPWWRDLKQFVQEQNLARHWEELKGQFQAEFAHEVDALIHGQELPDVAHGT